jgi:hypothetical protein
VNPHQIGASEEGNEGRKGDWRGLTGRMLVFGTTFRHKKFNADSLSAAQEAIAALDCCKRNSLTTTPLTHCFIEVQ